MPSLASRYFIKGAALRASSVGDSSGIAVTRNTYWANDALAHGISALASSDLMAREKIGMFMMWVRAVGQTGP
jgi:hypothetical protein